MNGYISVSLIKKVSKNSFSNEFFM